MENYNAQPGWLVHSTELSVEHCAAVPVHAVHVQPASFEQAMAPVFDSHAAAVPVHALPFQLQPLAWLQSAAETWVEQVAGVPVQAGFHAQPELLHAVEVAKAAHAIGVPLHDVPKTQPAISAQAVASAAELQSLAIPEQLFVEVQPLAVAHCCAERAEQAVALPLQTNAAPPAPPEPALAPPLPPTTIVPPEPALAPPLPPSSAPPEPAVVPSLPAAPATLISPACPAAVPVSPASALPPSPVPALFGIPPLSSPAALFAPAEL
ncbi:MAG TPA: hypothetical protein VER11_25780 [Polyangiaceae bacterium]|nr:hypothetical protein [Polyangiaceae bacterium]